MLKSDGAVVIDTRLNTGGLTKDVAGLKNQFGALGGSIKKLGGIIAAAFSVKAIVSFSKEAIELGSDLQEVQNVVDVTFTTMKEQVNEFAQNAAKTAGLSETMAKKYMGTFGAMSKSFGFTEREAYNMSSALTQMSGDVASFYNLTQDAAYTKLKSVFTGETESLKDLGVVMTQTALDDFALRKGLGKTVSQMSEQEKVALRYQFVMEQLSGASGDFVRTQDGWANQTRMLNLQFEQLKATLGQGLINVLTPAVKMLNTLVGKLQEFAAAFKKVTESLFGNASDGGNGIAESTAAAAESAGQLEDNIEAAGDAAKKAMAGFDEINVLTQKTEGSTESIESIIGSASGGQSQNVSVSNSEGAISAGVNKIASDLLKIKEKIQELAAPLKHLDFKSLLNSVKKLKNAIGKFGDVIGDKLERVWFDVLVPLGLWSIEKGLPKIIDTLSKAFGTLGNVIDYFGPAFDNLWNGFLAPLAKWTGKVAIGALDILGDALKAIGDHFDLSVPKAYELSEAEKQIAANADSARYELSRLRNQSEETERSIETQYGNVKMLTDELLLLADESGNVKDADKARADYILGELNTALGTEYAMVGDIISQYGKLKNEIYDLISAKKANAYLNANHDTYQKALLSEVEAFANREIAEKAYLEQRDMADRHIKNYQNEIAKLKEDQAYYADMSRDYGSSDPFGTYANKVEDIGKKIKKEERKIEAQKAAVSEALAEYKKAVAAYREIETTIGEYDQASALIAKGNYDEAVRILAGYSAMHGATAEEIEDAAERERLALEKRATNAGYYAQMLLEKFEAGQDGVTKEIVESAIEAYEKALEAFSNVDQQGAEKMGLNWGEMFAEGIRNSADTIRNAMKGVLGGKYMPSAVGFSFATGGRITLPHLASGAVIPPNAPFTAVLGDQRYGRNLEAPEGLIRQIMREELENMGINVEVENRISFGGDLAQLARVLKPAIDTETRRKGKSLASGGIY